VEFEQHFSGVPFPTSDPHPRENTRPPATSNNKIYASWWLSPVEIGILRSVTMAFGQAGREEHGNRGPQPPPELCAENISHKRVRKSGIPNIIELFPVR